MSSPVNRVALRIVGLELVASIVVLLIALSTRWLLVLEAKAADAISVLIGGAIALAATVGPADSMFALRRYRFLLRALALGSDAVQVEDLGRLTREAYRTAMVWLAANATCIVAAVLFARPELLDQATTWTVALLILLIASAAALVLYATLRATYLNIIELAPAAVTAELIRKNEISGYATRTIKQRLVVAVVAPVAFVTLGSTLVVASHIRRADEQQRETSALAVARSTFEESPGIVKLAGLAEASERAKQYGFDIAWSPEHRTYLRRHAPGGDLELIAPLDSGSVQVRLPAVSLSGIGWFAWGVTVAAVVVAAWLGIEIGRLLVQDLATATRQVRALDTRSVTEDTRRQDPTPRLALVAELSQSVTKLAGRFREFSKAQERAIHVGEATARMRGLFFASVSHDLKGPLNSILGFTEMVRRGESLTPEQEESLAVIDRSGRELLALIETILDAARVEAKQLQLVRETVLIDDLVADIVEKGHHLAGENAVDVIGDIRGDLVSVEVDRVRLSNALATFVGHAGRTVPGAIVRLHVAPLGDNIVGFALELPALPVPGSNASPNGGGYKAIPTHRGLALGMGLARSIIELHGGSIYRVDRGTKGLRFVVKLPSQRPEAVTATAPLYTSPLPPRATEKHR